MPSAWDASRTRGWCRARSPPAAWWSLPRRPTSRRTARCAADLAHHECLGAKLAEAYGPTHWSFGEQGEVKVPIRGRFVADNGEALRRAALAGLGIIYQPTFPVGDDLAAGALVALPLDHPPLAAVYIQAVFLRDRRMPLKTRAMIDFLAAEFGPEPPWDRHCPRPA